MNTIELMLKALKELDSWLVCAPIATPHDMAQSFEHMQQVTSEAIASGEAELKREPDAWITKVDNPWARWG
jgi:hypothetical protein